MSRIVAVMMHNDVFVEQYLLESNNKVLLQLLQCKCHLDDGLQYPYQFTCRPTETIAVVVVEE
jgi:hypothetical protein